MPRARRTSSTRPAFKNKDELLEHLGGCPETATTIARVLAGEHGERHARCIIGALMSTELLMSTFDEAELVNDTTSRAREDLCALYDALLRAHTTKQRLDA